MDLGPAEGPAVWGMVFAESKSKCQIVWEVEASLWLRQR